MRGVMGLVGVAGDRGVRRFLSPALDVEGCGVRGVDERCGAVTWGLEFREEEDEDERWCTDTLSLASGGVVCIPSLALDVDGCGEGGLGYRWGTEP